MRPPILASILAALMAGGCAASPQPETPRPVTLILADTFPLPHYAHGAVIVPFMKEAEARSGGKVHFDFRPNSTEGKDTEMLSLVQSGKVDLGLVTPSIERGRFPLAAVAELPGSSGSACGATEALVRMTREGETIYRTDFEPLGIVPVVRIVLWYYPIILAGDRSVRTMRDLEGLRLRAGTDAMGMTLRELGAQPLRLTPAQIEPAITNGEVDGAVVPYKTALDYGWLKWATSSLSGQSFGAIVLTLSIRRDRWNALAPDLRAALSQAGERASLEGCKNLDVVFRAAELEVAAKGLKLETLSPEEAIKLRTKFTAVRKAWADRIESLGLPGIAALESFERLSGASSN